MVAGIDRRSVALGAIDVEGERSAEVLERAVGVCNCQYSHPERRTQRRDSSDPLSGAPSCARPGLTRCRAQGDSMDGRV